METKEKAMPEVKIIKTYTDTQVLDHEAKVGGKRNLKEVIITDDEGTQYYYLVKRPTRSVVQASAEAMQKSDLKAQHKLTMGCVLEGDMEVIEQDGVMFSELLARVQMIGNSITSEIKNF
jgi:hypothetical protein